MTWNIHTQKKKKKIHESKGKGKRRWHIVVFLFVCLFVCFSFHVFRVSDWIWNSQEVLIKKKKQSLSLSCSLSHNGECIPPVGRQAAAMVRFFFPLCNEKGGKWWQKGLLYGCSLPGSIHQTAYAFISDKLSFCCSFKCFSSSRSLFLFFVSELL